MKPLLLAAMIIAGCTITGNATFEGEEHFNYTTTFCSQDNCTLKLMQLINNSNAKCALYNAADEVIENANVKTNSRKSGIMHNKFCVVDGRTVWTGSYNPTGKLSHDDVIVINSTLLAKNYLEEFNEIGSSENSETATTKLKLNNTPIENYFCPEDECIEKLQRILNSANESIYFATYSFTHPKTANELIIKNSSGVAVEGLIEQQGKWSQLETLQANGINATKDESRMLMHHKLWIIDNAIVVTGSFNPTRNADERNDENILVIHDEDVAEKYLAYFNKLR